MEFALRRSQNVRSWWLAPIANPMGAREPEAVREAPWPISGTPYLYRQWGEGKYVMETAVLPVTRVYRCDTCGDTYTCIHVYMYKDTQIFCFSKISRPWEGAVSRAPNLPCASTFVFSPPWVEVTAQEAREGEVQQASSLRIAAERREDAYHHIPGLLPPLLHQVWDEDRTAQIHMGVNLDEYPTLGVGNDMCKMYLYTNICICACACIWQKFHPI